MTGFRFLLAALPLSRVGFLGIAVVVTSSSIPAQAPPVAHFSRLVDDAGRGRIVLQLPVRRFERHGLTGPSVTLQSMVHIADRAFFERQQLIAEDHDVILFEKVRLPGAGPLKYYLQDVESDDFRIALTRTRLTTLGLLVKEYCSRDGNIPHSFREMKNQFSYLRFHDILAQDGWGNDFHFQVEPRPQSYADTKDAPGAPWLDGRLEIVSLGRDNRRGGEGVDADLLLSKQDLSQAEGDSPFKSVMSDVIQVARLLGMEFQGDVMVEGSHRWRSSDLAQDQVRERCLAAGVSPDAIGQGIASFPVGIISSIRSLVQATPSLKIAGKLVFVECIEKAGPDYRNHDFLDRLDKVIIGDRNQVVIDDLSEIIEKESQIKSVSIVYGGGHMPNLEARLREMGYQQSSVDWLDAITVQVPKSPVEKMKLRIGRNLIRKVIGQEESRADKHMEKGLASSDRIEALEEFQQALLLYEEQVKRRPSDVEDSNRLAVCCDQLGLTYQSLGQLESALEFFGRGETIRRSLTGRFPKDVVGKKNLAWSLARLGEVTLKMGQPSVALAFFEEARGIYQRLLDADPRNADLKRVIAWYDREIQGVKQGD